MYLSKNSADIFGSIKTAVAPFTNHLAVICSLKIGIFPRKPFLWKLDRSILKNENVKQLFINNWKLWGRQKSKYATTTDWWTKFAKPKIRNFFKQQMFTVNRDNKSNLEFFTSCLREAMCQNPEDPETFINIKKYRALVVREQNKLYNKIQQNFIKDDIYVGNENMSLYHIMKMRKSQNNKFIKKLNMKMNCMKMSMIYYEYLKIIIRNCTAEKILI